MMRKTQAMASGITTGLLLLLYVIPGTAVAQQSTEPQVVGMGLLGVDLNRVTVLAGAFGVGIGFGMDAKAGSTSVPLKAVQKTARADT